MKIKFIVGVRRTLFAVVMHDAPTLWLTDEGEWICDPETGEPIPDPDGAVCRSVNEKEKGKVLNAQWYCGLLDPTDVEWTQVRVMLASHRRINFRNLVVNDADDTIPLSIKFHFSRAAALQLTALHVLNVAGGGPDAWVFDPEKKTLTGAHFCAPKLFAETMAGAQLVADGEFVPNYLPRFGKHYFKPRAK